MHSYYILYYYIAGTAYCQYCYRRGWNWISYMPLEKRFVKRHDLDEILAATTFLLFFMELSAKTYYLQWVYIVST